MIRHGGSVLFLLLTIATSAIAAEPDPVAARPAMAVHREPSGRAGMSSFWEAIKRGDAAYVARNLDAAVREYQSAIEAYPQNPLGHYRLGCVLIAKSDFKKAQESLDTALRFSKSDAVTTGKVLFVIADLHERKQDYPAALAAWKSYAAFAGNRTETKTFAASAQSRQNRLTAYTKLSEQSAQVKERIVERLRAAELQRSSTTVK